MDREQTIKVNIVTDDIAACNVCFVRNYESRYGDGKVEDLYEVKLGTVCLTLCKKCLLELVEKSLMVTKKIKQIQIQ